MPYKIKPLQWVPTGKDCFMATGVNGTYHIAPNVNGGYTWWLTTYKCETGFSTVTEAKLSATMDHATTMLPYLETVPEC